MTYILVTLTCLKWRKHNIKYVVSCPAQSCLIKKDLLSEPIIMVVIDRILIRHFQNMIVFVGGGPEYYDNEY